jgi:hypothetical protein
MKNKISENSGLVNMAINLAILFLLIYLAVAVKKIEDKVFWPKDEMRPLMGMVDSRTELEHNITQLLNGVLKEAIQNQNKK